MYRFAAIPIAVLALVTCTGAGPTETNEDRVAPSAPTGVVAVALSSTQIHVTWSPASDNVGVTGYGVMRNGAAVDTVSGVSYSDTGLSPGTTYSYAVGAYDAAGNASVMSTAVSTTTHAAADTEAPSVPTGLGATAVSSSQIDLTWNASTDNVGVAGYLVFRDANQIDNVADTTFSDTPLPPGTQYSYTVQAYDAAGNISALRLPLCRRDWEPLRSPRHRSI
jgi:chitodextrinase